jgi:hypothetical protein
MTAYVRGIDGYRDTRMLELAIQSYQKSVEFLGAWIGRGCESWVHLSMLSSAFLLSLFEVWLANTISYNPSLMSNIAHV